jgi:RNA polymerase sigma-70 factor (ECF subfamily)
MTQEIFEQKIQQAIDKAKLYLLGKFKMSASDADDVLQNAAIKAFKNLSSFQEKCSFDTWFISIAKNEAKALFSKRDSSKELPDSDFALKNYSFSWVEPEVIKNEKLNDISHIIHEALLKLSDNHQQVIKLMLNNCSSCQEIADTLQIPVSSVRTRMFYAKKKLKKIIQSHAHQSNIELFGN